MQRVPMTCSVSQLSAMCCNKRLCCGIMHCVSFKCNVLQGNEIRYKEMECAAKKWTMLQRNGMCCKEIECVAKKWNVLQRNGMR